MPPSRGLGLALLLALVAGTLAACGGDEIETTPLPEGVVMHIDQSRVERKGREVFLRVENNTRRTITVEAFRLTSPRFDDVSWTGSEDIGATYETDLEFDLPRGRCGTDIDAEVTLTYRIGDGELRTSTGTADDTYGSAALFADRDCAETTLTRAADMSVGAPEVTGVGRDSVLRLPVTMTPTGATDDVSFTGFGSTPLFRQHEDSPVGVDVPLGPDDPPAELVMSVVPARCDPHALAEDKVGTLFGVGVDAPGLEEDTTFFLPLTKVQRSAFLAFFRSNCGLS
jgi:hypothetical protein